VFGLLMADCGFDPDQIRRIEFPDFVRYCNHSAKYPSTRQIVHAIAKSLGIEFAEPTTARYMTGEELKAFVDRTGGKIEGIGHG
jgi:hypothetical protein